MITFAIYLIQFLNALVSDMVQSLFQITNQVINMLDADGDANQVAGDAGGILSPLIIIFTNYTIHDMKATASL